MTPSAESPGEQWATFRFYAQLNDCLPAAARFHRLTYCFRGNPSVKDSVEALGVPHPEIELIVVHGQPVGFDYHLTHADQLGVYPHFHSFALPAWARLPSEPPRPVRFIADVHLGKLAAKLRLLGFDTRYRNDYLDPEIAKIASLEERVILTRDRGLLKLKAVRHGYWVRSGVVNEQVTEVLGRFDLYAEIIPFCRCLACNGAIFPVAKQMIAARVSAATLRYYEEFSQCHSCGQVYWPGSHHQDMVEYIKKLSVDEAKKQNT